MHLGNARTAVLNWAFARHHDGAFVLRFEDTDVARHVETAGREIVDGLKWLGIDPDEGPEAGGEHGPYRQSERLERYRRRAGELTDAGLAYRCYCTDEELERRREEALARGDQPIYDGRCRSLGPAEERRLRDEGRDAAIRFAVDPGPIRVTDRVRGEVEVAGDEFGDFVILRSDGRPTYNFAVVVDDVAMRISHVIRGVGHLANTPRQLLVYRALGVEPPEFVHIPHVLAPGGGRLSKREGATSLSSYRDDGYHPDAVVNYLSLLSWSSPSGDEFLTRERIVSEVDLDRLGVADTELDPEKMRWLSGRHIREEPIEELVERIRPFLPEELHLSGRDVRALTEVLRERIQLLAEAAAEARRLFAPPKPVGKAADALASSPAEPVLAAVADAWRAASGWTRAELRERLGAAGKACGISGREFYHPLRAALTGVLEGPELADVGYVIGRERALRRLESAISTREEAGDV
jgi:glutamyl-tRNA synthetase